MTKHKTIKIGFIALALVMAASVAKSSNLDASGYIIASSITGEPECQPGGAADCAIDS